MNIDIANQVDLDALKESLMLMYQDFFPHKHSEAWKYILDALSASAKQQEVCQKLIGKIPQKSEVRKVFPCL